MDKEEKAKVQKALDRRSVYWDRPYFQVQVLPELRPIYFTAEEPVVPTFDNCTVYSFHKEEYRLRISDEVVAKRWLSRLRAWLIALAPWPSVHRVKRLFHESSHRESFWYYSIEIFIHGNDDLKDFAEVAERFYVEECMDRDAELAGLTEEPFDEVFEYHDEAKETKVFR
jgi:hypothetical protein